MRRVDRDLGLKERAGKRIEKGWPIAGIDLNHRIAVRRAIIDQDVGNGRKRVGARARRRFRGEASGELVAGGERILDRLG